jgi:hypothetical protein
MGKGLRGWKSSQTAILQLQRTRFGLAFNIGTNLLLSNINFLLSNFLSKLKKTKPLKKIRTCSGLFNAKKIPRLRLGECNAPKKIRPPAAHGLAFGEESTKRQKKIRPPPSAKRLQNAKKIPRLWRGELPSTKRQKKSASGGMPRLCLGDYKTPKKIAVLHL